MEITRIGGLDPYSNSIPQIRKPCTLSSLPFMQGSNGLANDLTRRGVETAANLALNPLLHLGGKRNIHALILHQRQELSILGATISVASLGLLVGINHFMSVSLAVGNFIGNGVATVAINCREGELDREP